jgi:hypothetical protein
VEGGPNRKAIRTSNAKDKAAGVNSRFPRLKYIKIDQARELAAECRSGDASGSVRFGAVTRQINVYGRIY